MVIGSLGDIAARAAQLTAPAVIVVGEVVELARRLRACPIAVKQLVAGRE